MKKSYVFFAIIGLIACVLIAFGTPTSSANAFFLQVNAVAYAKDGMEIPIIVDDTTDNVYSTISDKISTMVSLQTTETLGPSGAEKSFEIKPVKLKDNIAKNIATEDTYIEVIPEPESVPEPEVNAETIEEENTNVAKYQKLEGSNEVISFDTEASNITYMGNYKLTAYCPCENCCGEYANNRAVGENGYVIVGTASGARAYANHTIAVDPDIIPYGTTVIIEIDGMYYEYVAEDCGGAITGDKIDVYFDQHEEACNFGLRYGNVYILK